MANTTWSTTDKSATVTLSGGNLIATAGASGTGVRAIDKQITGKFYWECTFTTYSAANNVGIYSPNYLISASPIGAGVGACAITSGGSGSVYVDGVLTITGLGTLASGVTVCMAVDCDTRLMWFRVGSGGNWNGNASYVPGISGGVDSRLGRGIPVCPSAYFAGAVGATTANFGDSAFVGAVPSGFTSGFPTSPVATTWNPADKASAITLSNGNLTAASSAGSPANVRATSSVTTGKYYLEYLIDVDVAGFVGLAISSVGLNASLGLFGPAGTTSVTSTNGDIYVDGANTGVTLSASFGPGATVCLAFDATAKLIWYRIGAGGNWNGSGTANPATGVGGVSTPNLGGAAPAFPIIGAGWFNAQVTANFGAIAFTGTMPTGFSAFSGTSIPTNALTTQSIAEQWITTNPDMQLTQTFVEEWATVQNVTQQAVVTFVAVEEWASVDMPVVPSQAVRVQVLA